MNIAQLQYLAKSVCLGVRLRMKDRTNQVLFVAAKQSFAARIVMALDANRIVVCIFVLFIM